MMTKQQFRPPAVPLVACDPYFSIWSMGDKLASDPTRHWTGAEHPMTSMIRIDGKAYRLMGTNPRHLEAFPQTGVKVGPTRTVYNFEGAGVVLEIFFLTPAFPHDLEVMSWPVTYIVWKAASTDGGAHSVSVYFDASPELAVNHRDQKVSGSRYRLEESDIISFGSQTQDILNASGDDRRIDWGYLYAAAKGCCGSLETVIANPHSARRSFAEEGSLPSRDVICGAVPANRAPVAAFRWDMGEISDTPKDCHMILAYDDILSIEYLNRRLKAYWKKDGMSVSELLLTAESRYRELADKCEKYDNELTADLRIYGEEYSDLCALAFRQCICAHKLVADVDGEPLFFSKENFSNGCIATVDVTYPASPFYLLLNPKLLVGCVKPILEYASLENRWKFPFAPHDLGQYPLANGQVYGGGERTEENQMPVEECGNMLILVGSLCKIGSADLVRRYWPVLTRWAEFLREKGLDPENQLCTDDFAGHLGHNANLSLKAILGLGSYARMAEYMGYREVASEYEGIAADFARKWMEMADEGDHYRLTFDGTDTWSQKYNLVWDRILGLNLFPAELSQKEVAYYLTKQNKYGLPLDSRKTFTKIDWILWTACLTDREEEFRAFVNPVWLWASETPDRVPLSDWFETTDGRHYHFRARSVVGGLFIKMLTDGDMWEKWHSRAL